MQGLVELPESLREQAIRADELSTAGIRLGELWTELMAGRLSLLDLFQTRNRCFLLMQRGAKREPLGSAVLETFEQVLLGGGQKCVAADSEVSASTVAMRCKAALRYLNIESTGSKVPLVFVVLAHAHSGKQGLKVGRRCALRSPPDDLLVVSFPRPELRLAELVSPGEYEVARLCTEGHTHDEIAGLRGTSRRTIANQLGSVFRRFRLSGRAEFLAWVARESGNPCEAPCEPELLLLGFSDGPGARPEGVKDALRPTIVYEVPRKA